MRKFFILIALITVTVSIAKSNPLQKRATTNIELMRMNLYVVNPDNTSYIVDGTLTQYGDYSNVIDGYDARKMTNPGENISELRGTTDLVIERRQTIAVTDSIFFRMWNMRKITYRMELVATNLNHPGLEGFLEDNYLHTSIQLSLSDTTNMEFTITNDPASMAQNRFRIIFKPASLPLEQFIALNALTGNHGVTISWKIENENNMKQFFIQKSADGSSYIDAGTVPASNSNIFQWSDYAPYDGKNYYRIKAISLNGNTLFSEVVNASTPAIEAISLFPVPSTSANLNLSISNQKPGNYYIILCNISGLPMMNNTFYYGGGKQILKLNILKELKTGLYFLTVIDPEGRRKVLPVVLTL